MAPPDDGRLVGTESKVQVHLVLRPPPGSPCLEETAREVTRTREFWDIEKYGQTFAASAGDLEVVRSFAREHHLKVVSEQPLWRTVTLEGQSTDLRRAFSVTLRECPKEAKHFRPRIRPMPLKDELSGVVEWIFGLERLWQNQQPLPPLALASVHPAREPVDWSGDWAQSSEQAPWSFLPPPRLAELYDFPREFQGEGVCVGVLTLLGDYLPSDMERFFAELDMPMPDIRRVGVGHLGKGSDDWANLEVTMDVQVTASCAPKARTAVYFPDARSYEDVTAWTYFKVYAMALFDTENRPHVLTLSAGLPEDLPGIWVQGEADILEELFMAAAILGVTICLPSGDSGSFYPISQGMFSAPSLVYYPGSSPWVLCCGGTSLEVKDGRVVDEVVWNRLCNNMNLIYGKVGSPANLGSSTGGVSTYFLRPEWQERVPGMPEATLYDFTEWVFSKPRVFRGRGCPDVSAHADFLMGYRILVKGVHRYGGGTSASAPLISALLARVCEGLGSKGQPRRLGFLNPLLYELQLDRKERICRPIVQGNNGGYSASPELGWNACTGLGALLGEPLLNALKKYYSRKGAASQASPRSLRAALRRGTRGRRGTSGP